MKIVRLTAENIKRLKAVDITPDGTVQVVTGRNAQGKSSVLDAIWLALGGGAASRETPRPVRDGEDHAAVTLDLGEFVVTRTWTGDKTALTVTAPDGAKYPGPQGILDALVGRMSFDPLEFTRLSAREQVAAMTAVVDLGIDLDALARTRQTAFDERTDLGRQIKALGDIPTPDPSVPGVEQSAADLVARIREAETVERQQAEQMRALSDAASEVIRLEGMLATAKTAWADAREVVENHVPHEDPTELAEQLSAVEDTNAKVRENASRIRKAADAAALHVEHEARTATVAACDEARAKALAAASFPVDGLGFDDSGVTYNGVPLAQASSAEQIRVSLAMAMSLNPRLRVVRIMDGSLLDAESLALITAMAVEHDYQVWVERVEDSSSAAVVIEDGEVA